MRCRFRVEISLASHSDRLCDAGASRLDACLMGLPSDWSAQYAGSLAEALAAMRRLESGRDRERR